MTKEHIELSSTGVYWSERLESCLHTFFFKHEEQIHIYLLPRAFSVEAT